MQSDNTSRNTKPYTHSFTALGTVWTITLYHDEARYYFQKIQEKISIFENKYSRFLPDSLLSQLNTQRSVQITPECIDIFQKGLRLYTITDGVFSFCLGDILEKRGYDSKLSFKNTSHIENPVNPYECITFSPTDIYLKGSCKVDLGGFGKGYLLDLLADFLSNQKVRYFLLNAGGDMIATSKPDGSPFKVGLQHAKSKKIIDVVELYNSALCSSSPYGRVWKNTSHIISFSGAKMRQSFVFHTQAYYADAIATYVSIVGDTVSKHVKNDTTLTYIHVPA